MLHQVIENVMMNVCKTLAPGVGSWSLVLSSLVFSVVVARPRLDWPHGKPVPELQPFQSR